MPQEQGDAGSMLGNSNDRLTKSPTDRIPTRQSYKTILTHSLKRLFLSLTDDFQCSNKDYAFMFVWMQA